MGKEERYGVEWGRGMVNVMVFHDHQMATPPEFQSHGSNIMAFDKGNNRRRGNKSCVGVYCTQVLKQ